MNTEINMRNVENGNRVVFLDWLRIIACFMVMLVHTCEPFYFDADGNTFFQSKDAARSGRRGLTPLYTAACRCS